MTRKELLKDVVSELGHADHAVDDARQILMHVLNISHADFLANDDLEVTRGQRSQATKLAKARSQHTPMAYLLGSREFFGRSLPVNKHTLIPRPETELMVEEAIALSNKDTQFIDVGTGSGAIAITLNLETAQPTLATDISKRALKIANKNAKKLGAHVSFHEGILLEPIWPNELKKHERVIIAANLPYLSTDMWETSPAEVREFEPKQALVSDSNDGLDLYRELLMQIQSRRDEFPKDLFVLLEIDPRQESIINTMVNEVFNGTKVQIKNDLAGKPRVVILNL